MPPRLVILDTNFLLIPFQFKIDIFSEIEYLLEISYELAISSSSISELKKISKQKGKNGIAAKLALKMLDANKEKIQVVQSRRNVDDWIVDYAQQKGAIVCTNDSKLRNRLKEGGIKMITLKGRSHIGFT